MLLSYNFLFTITFCEFRNSLDLEHRHLGDNAQIVVIKNAGHAFNVEKAKEFNSILKSFLVDSQLPSEGITIQCEWFKHQKQKKEKKKEAYSTDRRNRKQWNEGYCWNLKVETHSFYICSPKLKLIETVQCKGAQFQWHVGSMDFAWC